VHQLVYKNVDSIKMHGTTMKIVTSVLRLTVDSTLLGTWTYE